MAVQFGFCRRFLRSLYKPGAGSLAFADNAMLLGRICENISAVYEAIMAFSQGELTPQSGHQLVYDTLIGLAGEMSGKRRHER